MINSIMPDSAVTDMQKNREILKQGAAARSATRYAECNAPRAALGIFTKSPVIVYQQGFARIQRVHAFLLQDQSAKLLPKERVCNCLKKRIDKTKARAVMYNEVREKAHWSNVQRCGSIWTCPVCARQITEVRREELSQGITTWKEKHGGGVLLLTLTTSHTAQQSLSGLLAGLQRAYKRFTENLRVRALLGGLGLLHKVRGFEVTYGANGWHPHFHVLLLTEKQVSDFASVRDELAALWIQCCTRSGLNAPSMEHGLDLRDGSYAQKYVSKWGLDFEMTKGHVKQGRLGSYTPFDLLNVSLLEGVTINGRSASSLWQEFGIAMKGARQLVWSRGLKALLDLQEVTDEQAAQETENQAIQLRQVDDFAFRLLAHYQERHTFLECLAADYKNGCLGNGSAEALLIRLLEFDLQECA
jgi:hypothetical protein